MTLTPERRAALLRQHGFAYVDKIDRDMERARATPAQQPDGYTNIPFPADLAFIEARARSFSELGMDMLAEELYLVVDELHYYRARDFRARLSATKEEGIS